MANPGFVALLAGGGICGVATFSLRHGSQYSAPPTLRVHSGHNALPQLRQKPVASTLLCTAQVIACSYAISKKVPPSSIHNPTYNLPFNK